MYREPLAVRAAIVAAIAALLNVAVAFGWHVSGEQLAAINAAIGLIATAVMVAWSRGAVTPVADPHDDNGNVLIPLEQDY